MTTDGFDVAARIAAQNAEDLALRTAAQRGTCPVCGDVAELLRHYATANWLGGDLGHPLPLLTPDGEFASIETARYRVEDPTAVRALLDGVVTRSGDGWVELVDTPDGPWPRANLWFAEDGELVLACSGDRRAYYDTLFHHALPPVRFAAGSSQATNAISLRFERDMPFARPTPGTILPVPSVWDALDDLIQRAEARWVDEPAELLEGVVPRDAWSTSRGRAAVEELLDGSIRPLWECGVLAAFDRDRVRQLLGA